MSPNGTSTPQRQPHEHRTHNVRDDWEDWEDEDVVTPIMDDDQELIMDKTAAPSPLRPNKPASTRYSQPRYSVQKLRRLKSRQRQKAQNAKAGIKVVTDMATLQHQRTAQHSQNPDLQQPKFVDAAALRALEGSPNSASVGNWNWLKKKTDQSGKSPQSVGRSPLEQDLSPNDRPIVIGIALPSELAGREISPQTAVLETPHELPPKYDNKPPVASKSDTVTPLTPSQQRSVWSPDTPDTTSPFQSPHRSSSIYSQATGLGLRVAHDAPPVPSVPSTYKQQERVVSVVLKDNNEDDDDGGSPCTLFEEDGAASNRRRSTKAKEVAKSPDSAATQTRGWWDHITTPFLERKSPIVPTKSGSQPVKETQHGEWWSEKDTNTLTSENKDSELEAPKPPQNPPAVIQRPGLPASPKPSPRNIQAPIVRVPTPRRTPSPLMDRRDPSPACSSRSATPRPQVQSEKVPFTQSSPALSEQPPPYSPPQQQKAVRYRAVFPAGHPLQALYPPSPGPISPAINGTMSSQGGISMTDIPLTPPARGSSPAHGTHGRLPERLAGTFVPQEHFLAASGDGHRVERERRRHEKEEMAARKLGGFWKGRWCIPASGCYGRSGREGRKRRRMCLGVCGASLALSILIIVLCVTLISRNSVAAPVDNMFVNLTRFPPMPTGVLSVVGPDNTAAVTGCSSPSTVWSCALPKEEHDSVAPYRPNQPTFIMQIQWDNNTRNLWDVPNGEPPRPGFSSQKRASTFGGIIARAGAYVRRQNPAFAPSPSPPSFEEMYFLGNTTDGIISNDKGGEPTPFHLSILKSANETVGPNALDKRQNPEESSGDILISLPAPDLEADGTGAPAQLFPHAVQQPVRLYDRGLPTEHYGFYTYFKRTIYLKSVTTLNGTDGESNVPLDKDGGSRRSEAKFLVTWSQTRFLVQIWTRSENNTQLLTSNDGEKPGTMPYPVTVKTDTHGGRSGEKFVWHWPVDDRQGIDTANPKLLPNDIGFGGTTVNPRKDKDASFGGFDGGTGGCRCEWVNFVARRDGGR
ncbi:glycoprotease family protein [Colletotrichum incanum]|uniref:Glycoprotease family protein n=1 Tax=Colletotrichum incanum TaxID=1573173 RepID=A0A161WF29_COLIC|nr:glycoprotease family protein [Colletotrichum incanum]